MTQKRTLFFFLVLVFILTTTYLVIKMAKGYKPDLTKKTFLPTGLLVATSVPDGAQIFLDGKLKSATNTTISLSPGEYQVEIKKDGYHSWKKTLQIEKELVTKTDAYLFPLVPDLKALTFTGAQNPVISTDETKVVYLVWGSTPDKNGLWVLDLNDFPFGILREPRQILQLLARGRDFSLSSYRWSPDSKQILLTVKEKRGVENFLIDPNVLISESSLIDISQNLPIINKQWANEQKLRDEQKLKKLPLQITEIIKNKITDVSFSPDETKILYTATDSARIPDNIIPPVPGAPTQLQERALKPYRIYVYDIKEDQNFFIMETGKVKGENKSKPTPTPPTFTLTWSPTSMHLLLVEKDKATIIESDGTNRVEVYSGHFEGLSVFPFPSGTKLLVLTSISSDINTTPNLYAVNLR